MDSSKYHLKQSFNKPELSLTGKHGVFPMDINRFGITGKARERPTIGLLNYGTKDPCSLLLWAGVNDAVRKRNANLICFPANPINSHLGYDYQANVLFDLANKECIDGLVLWSSLLIFYSTVEEMRYFHIRYKQLPIVSISLKIEGVPSIVFDNYNGMKYIIEHLIKVHGYRKIAFVQGPSTHLEAQERYRAYVEVLIKNGISFDPDLVAPGDFNRPSGENAVNLLLDVRKQKPDAIAAANDVTAFDVIEALKNRGIRVPGDIAVTGFDDLAECVLSTPPLTTITQQFYNQGIIAANILLDIFEGKEVPEIVNKESELIIRQSCGCIDTEVLKIPVSLNSQEDDNMRIEAGIDKDLFINDISGIITGVSVDEKNIEQLQESFIDGLENPGSVRFLSVMNEILSKMVMNDIDIISWQEVITTLRKHILPLLPGKYILSAENLFQQIRLMISKVSLQAEGYKRIVIEAQNQKLSEIAQKLITSFNLKDLTDIMAGEFPLFGISKCYLALYEAPLKPTEWSRILLAYDENGRIKIAPEGLRFSSKMLLPEGLLNLDKRFSMIVEPLYFREDQLGFVLFESNPQNGKVFDLLRVQLSSALKGALLVNNLESDAVQLAQSKSKLEATYQDLKENQEKLLLSEIMASLGRLSAEIAHEMSTPIAAIRAALIQIKSLTDEYNQSIDTPEVLPADHHAIAGEMKKNIETAMRSAEKSAGFIRGIKAQTPDKIESPIQYFKVAPILKDVVNLLEFAFKKVKCNLVMELDETSVLYGDPRWFSQIASNLIKNSIDACNPNGGQISLTLSRTNDGQLRFTVIDNGIGIPPENMDKIFDSLFTTKPFGEGTGLGLSLVKRFVNEFKGTINVESRPGHTIFSILFPKDGK